MGTQTAGGGAPAMQRVRITVVYDDGGTDTVILRPVSLVMAERHFKGIPPQVEGTLFAAWWQLDREQHAGNLGTFGDWLDRLAHIEEKTEDPTEAAPPKRSPRSPSTAASPSASSSSSTPTSTTP